LINASSERGGCNNELRCHADNLERGQAGAGTETLEIRTSTIITLGFHPAVCSYMLLQPYTCCQAARCPRAASRAIQAAAATDGFTHNPIIQEPTNQNNYNNT